MTTYDFEDDEATTIVDVVLVFLDLLDEWAEEVEDGTVAFDRVMTRRETLASIASKLGWTGTLFARDERRRILREREDATVER